MNPLTDIFEGVEFKHVCIDLWRCSVKKGVIRNFAIFQTCNFIKKSLQHRRFPVKFAKFLRALILKNICERLLLLSLQLKLSFDGAYCKTKF